MPRMKKLEDLDRRLDILMMKDKSHIMNELCKIDVYNEFNSWTPLKLIALSYFVGPYLRIIGKLKEKWHGNLFVAYVDAFAGSGINKLGDSYTLGSPIAAIDSANTAEHKFDMMYLVDINKDYTKAMERRLNLLEKYEEYEWISGRYKIYEEDVNSALLKIVDDITKRDYINYLTFIDPYKCDIKWQSLAKLLAVRGDLLITHQARLIAKEVGNYKIGRLTDNKVNEISEYLGVTPIELYELDTEEKIKDFYIEKVKEYKEFVREWTVKSGKGYKYYLIFASSQKNPGWKNIIENLSRFETFSGDLVKHCLDRMEGKAPRLTDFF